MDEQMLKVIDNLEAHPQIYRIPMQCVLDEGASKDLGITGSIEPCEAYLLYNFCPELLSLPHLSSYENSPEYVIKIDRQGRFQLGDWWEELKATTNNY